MRPQTLLCKTAVESGERGESSTSSKERARGKHARSVSLAKPRQHVSSVFISPHRVFALRNSLFATGTNIGIRMRRDHV